MEELLAQLLQQSALRTKAESDAKHGALVQHLRATKAGAYRYAPGFGPEDGDDEDAVPAGTFRPSPAPGMRGNPMDPADSHQDVPRVPIPQPPPVVAGQDSNTALAAFGAEPGVDIGDGGPPLISSAEARRMHDRFGRRPDSGLEPLDLITDESMLRDDDVQQTGWLESDLAGLSHAQAAALIADQLRTRRIRTLGPVDPEYISKLPVY